MTLVLLNAFVLKELHHLLDHHHEAELHCESEDEQHLHSEEYGFEHCFICFISFAPFETPEKETLLSPLPQLNSTSSFAYINPFSGNDKQFIYLRGPPAA